MREKMFFPLAAAHQVNAGPGQGVDLNFSLESSVAEPELQGAASFGRSRSRNAKRSHIKNFTGARAA
jgi:hypothetical protein